MKKRVLLVLLLILALLLCGCNEQGQQAEDPTQNDPTVQAPENNDPPPDDPEVQTPAETVCPNPAIANLLDTINAALAEAGHPIKLAHPTTPVHEGELEVLFTGNGKNPYVGHLQVSLYQHNDTLGYGAYEDSFYCAAYNDPAPEVENAIEVIFSAALPLYDSALNERYTQAFLSLRPVEDQSRYNIYGAVSRDGIQAGAESSTTTTHELRGLRLMRTEAVYEAVRSVSFAINRMRQFRPVMSPVYRQDMLDTLGKVYQVEGPLNIETDTEDWSAEYSDAIISHPEFGEMKMGFNSRTDDGGIRVAYAEYNTAADKEKLDWFMDVCSRMLNLCSDQYNSEEQAAIIDAVRNSEDGAELEFESESRSMRVQLYRSGDTYTFYLRMELGEDPLKEEALAEINTWFAWDKEPGSYPVGNSFLTCIYTQPGEMNLFEVFGGQGGTDNQNGQISDAERDALAKVQEHYASGYEVQKFKRSSMDKILKKHTGYKLEDLQWSGLDAFVYLDHYDAYYTVYGGTNKGSYTMVEGWKNPDGTLSLVYKNDKTVYETGYEYCVVTLKPAESGDSFHGYWFVSNLPYIN